MCFRLLTLGIVMCAAVVNAASGPTADELAKKGFGSSFAGFQQGYAEMRMVVTKSSTTIDRTISFKSTRDSNGKLLYLMRFESPADIKGTAFLVQERKGALPAQYMYLPATKQVQEVAAGKATSSFFGTDFIFADLLPYPTDKKDQVTLTRLEDRKVGGQDCYVLQVAINDTQAPYSRIVASIQSKEMVPVQVEFFDRNNRALKTLRVRKLKKVDGKLIPVEFEMKNEQVGSKTEVWVNNIDSKKKFQESEFTKDALRSGG